MAEPSCPRGGLLAACPQSCSARLRPFPSSWQLQYVPSTVDTSISLKRHKVNNGPRRLENALVNQRTLWQSARLAEDAPSDILRS
jgi:hypothetical protein